MSSDYFILSCLIVVGTGIYGLVVYALGVRSQRRWFAEHPEYRSPFDDGRNKPAE